MLYKVDFLDMWVYLMMMMIGMGLSSYSFLNEKLFEQVDRSYMILFTRIHAVHTIDSYSHVHYRQSLHTLKQKQIMKSYIMFIFSDTLFAPTVMHTIIHTVYVQVDGETLTWLQAGKMVNRSERFMRLIRAVRRLCMADNLVGRINKCEHIV
jgi:hypothetical protein